MHLKSLKIFCDVVHRRSFSRAADENGVSQSNASQVVQQLEERLGVQLLNRSTRPFMLTPEGERYYEGCRGIVRKYFDLEREIRSLHEAKAVPLRVASIYSVGLAHMSRYLREFRTKHPECDVRLEYLHPDSVYEAVENAEADLGIVSYPEQSRSLTAIAWRSEALIIACHSSHALAGRKSAPISALRGEQFIALEQGLKIREEIDHALAFHNVEVNVALEFDNIETIKRAIEAGVGVSLLPAPTVEREAAGGSLKVVPLAGLNLVRPLGVIHRRDEELSSASKMFVDLLQSHAYDEEFASVIGKSTNGLAKPILNSVNS